MEQQQHAGGGGGPPDLDQPKGYYKEIMMKSKYSATGNQGIASLKQATKVIIDCDPGGDDCQALVLAFDLAKKKGIPILGVTTVAGNACLDQVVLNTQLIVDTCHESNVQIYRGEEPKIKGKEGTETFYGLDGFGGTLLEYIDKNGPVIPKNVAQEGAVDFLIRIAQEYPGEITIVCLAPLTNLGKAIKKSQEFAKNVKNVCLLGGTYLAQGNTDYYCSEFNIFKDPEAAQIVFDNLVDITMVPFEACLGFKDMDPAVVAIPFTQQQTAKGKLVFDSFRDAAKKLGGKYKTNDPQAVAVAMHPEIVEEIIEKTCYIECEGRFTKGMVVIDWFEHWPQQKQEAALNSNPRRPVKIVTKMNLQMLLDIMLESVLSE